MADEYKSVLRQHQLEVEAALRICAGSLAMQMRVAAKEQTSLNDPAYVITGKEFSQR